MADIEIEVAYALPDRQALVQLSVPMGTTVRQAARLSGLADQFPGLDFAGARLGIFGKPVMNPDKAPVASGDRVEIYRALLADPKEVRKQRAARAAGGKGGRGVESK